ncbi:MFS transporter [Luteipulveratus mongoliensis]|uniref:Nitrate transporter n=1 Tax=Luteipulveratus mongoliensis TaxID=571913 RepID=A0A0K1JG02_9MICO|nr:nitrate/nitrite transporter [Luteipulveratus mongoliensis]AKU15525.1 nitrate transporter [Luteipulveratus mongoliensis]
MAATVAESTTTAPPSVAGLHRRSGRWIDGWDPEDTIQWAAEGRSVARRNLWLSVFAEFLGFGVFALWGIVVPQLKNYGYAGAAALSDTQQFWLISIPVLVGATLRIPYTFAVPKFGGRNWTIASALLLLFPTVGLALAVGATAPFPVLVMMAALAGLGGGNFASSMANISFFFPQAEKGKALGFNAAGGNLGTAAVQFAVPLVVVIGAAATTKNPNLNLAGWIFVPLIALSAFLAWRWMDNLSSAKADPRSFAVAARRKHTWVLSFIYFGTFGSFIGFAGAFPKIMTDAFPDHGLKLAFLGALVGSVARPLGGIVSDRFGGWIVTVISFVAMAIGALGAIYALKEHSFGLFMATFLLLFVFTGVGNGSIYRMIPAVFHATSGDDAEAQRITRRIAAGAIGIVGAVGAYGGFVIPQGFSYAKSHTIDAAHKTGTIIPALWVIIAVYLVMAATTWAVYGRKGTDLSEARI